jgi:hypothetical protein
MRAETERLPRPPNRAYPGSVSGHVVGRQGGFSSRGARSPFARRSHPRPIETE